MPTRGSLCSPRAIFQRPCRGAKAIIPQESTRRIAHFIAIPALNGWAKIMGLYTANIRKQMALGETPNVVGFRPEGPEVNSPERQLGVGSVDK
jgi:hypothetical protein